MFLFNVNKYLMVDGLFKSSNYINDSEVAVNLTHEIIKFEGKGMVVGFFDYIKIVYFVTKKIRQNDRIVLSNEFKTKTW